MARSDIARGEAWSPAGREKWGEKKKKERIAGDAMNRLDKSS